MRDYSKLPEKYWNEQNLCWYLHDIILSILVECVENDRIGVVIKEKDNFQGDEEEFYEHFKDRHKGEYNNLLGKQIFHALASDMCNYIYESLSTIEKGKVAVSYALLRKPFRDSLLYLEWLLKDKNEIIELVDSQRIEKYAIENISKSKKEDIINYSIENNPFKDLIGFKNTDDENFWYNLRYDYNSAYSLQLMWNKANHLVTTGRNIKTTDFNFVFMEEDNYDELWSYYYSKMSVMLLYTLGVVINLYDKEIRKLDDTVKIYNKVLILSKFCLYKNIDDLVNEYIKMNTLFIICEKCKKALMIDRDNIEVLRNNWEINCESCNDTINLCRYFFLDDIKNNNK